MRCPFVDRDCIKNECAGWIFDKCFIFALTQKIEIITQNISTLNNNISKIGIGTAETHAEEPPPGDEKQAADITADKTDEKKGEDKIPQYNWDEIAIPEECGESILAIDFGTSLSKASIKSSPENTAIPIPLHSIAAKIISNAGIDIMAEGNEFVEESIVYIDNDGNVLCGQLAADKHFSNTDEDGKYRMAIRGLKQYLIKHGEDGIIASDSFPGSEKLSIEDVITTYLAYLFYLSKTYVSNKSNLKIDLNATIRNFSIPVWENQEHRVAAKEIMKRSIVRAYYLEQWLQEKLVLGVPLQTLCAALKDAGAQSVNDFIFMGTDVTEPVAAGYSRIYDFDIETGTPNYLFIIDVGSGSTDFALLTISKPIESEEIKVFMAPQGGVSFGVSSWDDGLKSLIYTKLREERGVTPDSPIFNMLNADLERNIRFYKERIIASGNDYKIDFIPSLKMPPLGITKDELEATLSVSNAIEQIGEGFKNYIAFVTSKMDQDKFNTSCTEFLVTGGGSFIPSIVETIKDCTKQKPFGTSYTKKVINNYLPDAYEALPNFNDIYPMMAVSLGSTENEYPEEKVLPRIDITPVSYEIGGYYQKGD